MFTLPKCSSSSGIVGRWLTVRSAPWTVDGVWLARCPHLRRRSSSADVPDNVPESHTAGRPFPGPRHASWPDVPDNRPLSDGSAGRPGPQGIEGSDIAVHEPFPPLPGCSDDDVDVRVLLCTGPVGREEARPCAVGQPPYPRRGFPAAAVA